MYSLQEPLIEDAELRLLLDGLVHCYGFDFREYDLSWVRRRVWERVREEGLQTISGLQERVIHDPSCMERLLTTLVARVPSLFSDPEFYTAFRTFAVPLLRTYPSVSVWAPACSTGEDAYALAILLEEEQLASRSVIHATDMSDVVWESAREGRFPLPLLEQSAEGYRTAGGVTQLSNYYTVQGDDGVMRAALRDMIVFGEHNLATDAGFNEFQVVVCRQALSMYTDWLQERVLNLFYQSLSRFGLLGLHVLQPPMTHSESKRYKQMGLGLYQKLPTT